MSRAATLQPILSASAAQVEAWIRRAAPGQVLLYAEGPSVDGVEAAIVARSFADQGLVRLLPNVKVADFHYKYSLQRVAPAVSAAPPKPTIDRALAGTDEGEMLRLIGEIADAGLPCPTNAELAEALHLRNGEAARYVLKKLAGRGLVRVVRDGEWRIVTIVETGASTAAKS